MKGELLILNKKLGFFFRKRDVKTEADKRAICEFIEVLYNSHCTIVDFKIEYLEDILEQVKTVYIGCMMNDDYDPEIKFLGYTEKEFKEIKEVGNKLYELQY